MTFSELQREGARLTPAQIEAQLRNLLSDPRAPALVAWLERYGEDWARTMTSQKLAGDHGKLAHAAGSTYALQLLNASLRQLLEAKAKRPPQSSAEL